MFILLWYVDIIRGDRRDNEIVGIELKENKREV